MKIRTIAFTLLAAAFSFPAHPAKAQELSKIRIVRLSFVEGDVQFQRPGQDWEDARLNLPIEEGFSLRTADGYAEVEFEDALALRVGTNSTVEFTELSLRDGGRISQLRIPEGTAIVSAKLRRGDSVSIVAGNMTVDLPHDARFRMDVSPSKSWVTVFHGKVQVDSGTGTSASLTGGHTLRLTANASSPEISGNPPQDDFDKWVSHREQALGEAQGETSAVLGTNYYTAGYADLYNYGFWSTIPGFGLGWLPYGIGPGWMPFTDGEWLFTGSLGWNWIGAEPWGWLPYHYGYWVNAPGFGWAWLPPSGPYYWSPANANWVNVNNQLGWVPTAPPLGSKPPKKRVAPIPVTAVLGTRSASGGFKASSQISLAKGGVTVQPASAPTFVPTSASAQSNARENQSASAARTSAMGAPPSVRAPIGAASQVRAAGLGSAPRTLLAPHSAPAPVIARGASSGGFGGRLGGGAGHSGAGIGASSGVSAPTSAQGSSGAASHAGGSVGSASGHH